MPPIQGYLADHIGIHLSYIVPALCFVYVFYYGVSGSKIRAAAA